jgi:hypothetical protein
VFQCHGIGTTVASLKLAAGYWRADLGTLKVYDCYNVSTTNTISIIVYVLHGGIVLQYVAACVTQAATVRITGFFIWLISNVMLCLIYMCFSC